MAQEGNEVSNAVRLYLIADSAIAAEVGGAGNERIYAEDWPRGISTWPSILVEDLAPVSRIETPALGEDVVQASVYGNPAGGNLEDHTQKVRTIANLIRTRLANTALVGQAPLISCLGCSIIPAPRTDPDTYQPVQRVHARLLVDYSAEAVTP